MEIGVTTNPGPRPSMQDTALTMKACLPAPLNWDVHILLVADGVGGQLGGERASALAASAFAHGFLESLWAVRSYTPPDVIAPAAIASAEQQVRCAVAAAAEQEPGLSQMASTLTAAITIDRLAYVAWCGDSRAYYFDGNSSRPLTRDHSKVNELLDAREIEDAADVDPRMRNVITRSVNARRADDFEITVRVLQPPDSTLWICSDGLPEGVSIDFIDRRLRLATANSEPMQRVTDELVRAAIASGSTDNISLIAAQLPSNPPNHSRTWTADYGDVLPTVTPATANEEHLLPQ